jgi:23S rRNA (pseudouridine1915-N3)-methyltransferase
VIKVKFLSIGRTKEAWLEEAIQEYVKRLSGEVSFEFVWLKDQALLESAMHKEKGLVLLDACGKAMDSVEFSHFLFSEFERGGSRLTFVIGGADGFSEKVKKQFPVHVSLSKMTFTHQMIRLILMEQIFRAFEIGKGSGYHK